MDFSSIIDVAIRCPGWNQISGAEPLLRGAAKLALSRGSAASRLVWQGTVELGISLVNDAQQTRLNHDYRHNSTPTNVLAFSAWEPSNSLPPGATILLGDVVLAFETVAREAAEQDKSIADHLCHLVIHGVLHLLGYDHMTPVEAMAMESLETSILAEVGISDPYRDPMSFLKPLPASHERF